MGIEKYILLLSFVLFGVNLFAQSDSIKYGKLEVKVIDAKTKKPIEYALVKLEAIGLIKAKYSDNDGEIIFDSLKSKTYKISIIYTGYNKQIYEDFKIDSLCITFKKIELQENKNFVFITRCGPPIIKKDEPTHNNYNKEQIMRMPY
jgi:hypothetical protein